MVYAHSHINKTTESLKHFYILAVEFAMKKSIHIMWFRRDLRLHDNAALFHALKSNLPVLPIFIFDSEILDKLEDKADARVSFIHRTILNIQKQLREVGSDIEVRYGKPLEVFQKLVSQYDIKAVYTNRDYELYARRRDEQVEHLMRVNGASFHEFKDHVVFDQSEVVKDDGLPYTVFTPYSKKWRAKLEVSPIECFDTKAFFSNFFKCAHLNLPSLASMGFTQSDISIPSSILPEDIVRHYSEQRDFPAIQGTTRLGIHYRFGTVSIREMAKRAIGLNQTYLNELIWRDFYHMILWHFPHVCEGKAFRKEYDTIEWRRDEGDFEKWCNGKTGYPIVDAGIRELNATGYMHNRVRMIVASFLAKHLLLDWRLGEAYFAAKLLDFDFAANNGGWQWAAGSGCDAAPYFRVFNPTLQTEKFDKKLEYIRKWVPELDSFDYPKPMVVHEVARKRALDVYGRALKK